MGKSVFGASLAKSMKEKGCLVGAVFFKFNDKNRSDPIKILYSLAYQAAINVSGLAPYIEKAAVELKPSFADSLEDVFNCLLAQPLNEYGQAYQHNDNKLIIVGRDG